MTQELTTPQYIYLAAVGCYLLFFALFLRLFWWKRYADQNFWHRRPELSVGSLQERAAAAGQALPRFSILVPARNEADVIEKTVEHMATLQYPPELYEVLVVTDEKEAIAAARRREEAVASVAGALRDGVCWRDGLGAETEAGGLLLAMIGALSLEGFEDVRQRLGGSAGVGLLRQVPEPLLRPMIWETSDLLMQRSRKQVVPQTQRLLRLRLPKATDEELVGAHAALLALAIPTAVAYSSLRGGDGPAVGRRLAALAAQANHSLTREIIQSMGEALALDLIDRLQACARAERFEERLAALYREIFPTTQDIMERKVAEFSRRTGVPVLKHTSVPPDFDGELDGRRLGVEVPSTKGRALNWALSTDLDGRTAWCGFYDAESRPDPRVMLYVAHQILEGRSGERPAPRIFQGPVFQVRNWYEMGPFCKIASLYQAVAHDWYLPVVFKRLPFVGGTNLFLEARLLREIGGYDYASLTEDLELGTRAYLLAGAWPEYLPYPSSEQTPPTFAGFYRQRLRWATGHLQVMAKVKSATQYDDAKRRQLLLQLWRKGQGEWIFYQAATLVPPMIVLLWFLDLVDPNVLGPGWHLAMNLLSTVYLGFTIYAFFRYAGQIDHTARPRKWLGQLGAMAQLLVLPLAAFLFPVPYSSALVLSSMGKGPSQWVKTPRTRE